MAIYIQGKTICRICGRMLTSSAGLVGFPNIELPPGLGKLADSCVHRSCLDTHIRHNELLQAWKQHWLAQAERSGAYASVNLNGVAIFNGRRFTFTALDSFIELEDTAEAFEQLRTFFASFNGHEALSTMTAWNEYQLAPGTGGTQLMVTANTSPSTAIRATQDGAMLDYEFTAERWTKFAHGWGALNSRPASGT